MTKGKDGRVYLDEGDRFNMHPDTGDTRTYECVRVTFASATIRCAERTRTDFTAHRGRTEEADVGFDKPGRRFTICPSPIGISLVVPVVPA